VKKGYKNVKGKPKVKKEGYYKVAIFAERFKLDLLR